MQFQRIMQSEGVQTSYQTVQRTIKQWTETGNYKDRARKGGVKRVLEEHFNEFIDEAMSKNDELTASNLMEMIQDKFGHEAIRYSLPRMDIVKLFGRVISSKQYSGANSACWRRTLSTTSFSQTNPLCNWKTTGEEHQER